MTKKPSFSVTVKLPDADATEKLGETLAVALPESALIFLQGDLGAGKTTLVRGVLRALGHQGAVKSPTYTILEEYSLASKNIIHFDLYRLVDPEELDLIGIRDYFNATTICFIEWPDRGSGCLPVEDLTINIDHQADARIATLSANSEKGRKMIEKLA